MNVMNEESSAEGATSSELLECITCDSRKIAPMRSMFGGYYFECLSCGRMSSLWGHETIGLARDAWNYRPMGHRNHAL